MQGGAVQVADQRFRRKQISGADLNPPISARTFAESAMAQGSEPSSPAWQTAIAIAEPFAPAIGA